MNTMIKNFVLIVFCLLAVTCIAEGMYFNLPYNTEKCLREEIHKDVLVKGDYEIKGGPQGAIKVNMKVTDSNAHVLYQKEDATVGKFAFTTDDYDMFQICFISKTSGNGQHRGDQQVSLVLKRGIEAKNYDEIAKADKLKPLEVELRRLEELSSSIASAFFYMKKREEEMRETNESTNSRVLWFSVASMLCLMGLATWQVWYLRNLLNKLLYIMFVIVTFYYLQCL